MNRLFRADDGAVDGVPGAALALASWATEFEPSDEDRALAERSLRDTLAVMYAAREHPLWPVFERLPDAGRWAALAHVLDFDDLHMPSTTHISAICIPVALATGGGADAYLAGAGVMTRLGTALGWRHYNAGWHATCTAGAPAAAVTAAIANGLDAEQTAIAIALAIPAAGGLQRAFGTAGKALQVGFAADAGVRAAALAQAGATADLAAVDEWIELVNGAAVREPEPRPAVPRGLAIKLHPCCYALQRPIAAMLQLPPPDPHSVKEIRVTTPAPSLKPLVHSRPSTGLEGKFSLEYALAATLLDGPPDLESFTDEAVSRPEATRLMDRVRVETTADGHGLLDGELELEVELDTGERLQTTLKLPPGAPGRPPTDDELGHKLEACAGDQAAELAALRWESATQFLEEALAAPYRPAARR